MSHVLPPKEERDALLDELSAIVRRHGFESFLFRPLVRATPAFFPDDWQPTLDGASVMADRLFKWTQLGEAKPVLSTYDGASTEYSASVGGLQRNRQFQEGATLLDLADGEAFIGIDSNRLDQPELLAGALARTVAQVWRSVRRAEASDDALLEAQRVDLTCVYLGLGVLATNNGYYFRRQGEVLGHSVYTTTQLTQEGSLSLGAMSFLLGAQLCARGPNPEEVRLVLEALEPRQRDLVREAMVVFGKDPEGLRDRLGLPPKRLWTSTPVVEPAASAAPVRLQTVAASPRHEELHNAGRPVFRVPHRRWWLAFVGMLVGVPSCFRGDGASTALIGFAVAGALGWMWTVYSCSGTSCERRVRLGDKTCAWCGGEIAGTIKRRMDRFEAEERWRRERSIPADDGALEALALEPTLKN